MRVIGALVKKELRLLLRDRYSALLLLGMPLLFILVLGLLLGESFGQKPDDTLMISIVDIDEGPCPIVDPDRLALAAPAAVGLLAAPGPGPWLALPALHPARVNYRTWAEVVRADLLQTPGIRVEAVPDAEIARRLVRDHKRPAVLVLEPDFSAQVNRCSFLDTPGGINPFHREGVHLDLVRANLLKDGNQLSTASVIEQVVQVSMLRVILPYMIGQAFERLSEPRFIDRLGDEVQLPVPEDFGKMLARFKGNKGLVKLFDRSLYDKLAEVEPYAQRERVKLAELLKLASGKDAKKAEEYRAKVGTGVQSALEKQFNKYNLTGKTWAALTKSSADGPGARRSAYEERDGSGLLRRGAHRYQVLVPAYTVMFAFFLVLTVGWVFVAERRQGTLLRLRAAPLTRGHVLLGKLVPCFLLSLGQGVFLLVAGRLLFGMRWGPEGWPLAQQAGWLLLVVFCTSLAAMGLALLVAAVAKSEMQVALYGAVPVLVLALIGGCVLPRELMPEQTQRLSLLTPQGWALEAYRELLNASASYEPNLEIVLRASAVLAAFGAGFLALAWGLLRLD